MRRFILLAPLCLGLAFTAVGCGDDDNDDLMSFRAAPLSGSNEVPANASTAAGTATFEVDGTTVRYRLELSAITGVTAAHIHSGVTGENGPIRVSLFTGPTTGTVEGMLVDGSFTAADVNGVTFEALMAEMAAGTAYVNVHTTAYPAGEIRAQVQTEQ